MVYSSCQNIGDRHCFLEGGGPCMNPWIEWLYFNYCLDLHRVTSHMHIQLDVVKHFISQASGRYSGENQ